MTAYQNGDDKNLIQNQNMSNCNVNIDAINCGKDIDITDNQNNELQN